MNEKEEVKSVKLTATRNFIADLVAGRMKAMRVVNSLDPDLNNNYINYDSDTDLFEIIYYSDDCPEGTEPIHISPVEYEVFYLDDYIKKEDLIKHLIIEKNLETGVVEAHIKDWNSFSKEVLKELKR